LTVAVVNPTWDTYKLDIDLENAKVTGAATTWVIAGDNPLLYNTPGEDMKVAIEEAGDTDLTKQVTLAPLSVTLYKVSVR
jgi:alpha-L-arabinofuranosidase